MKTLSAKVVRDSMKNCTRCNREKEISQFRSAKGYKDNLSSWCRNCETDYQKTRRANKIINVTVTSKICSICKVEKVSGEFSKSKTTRDGLDPRCKNCYRDITRERRGGLNPETVERRELRANNQFKCYSCEKIFFFYSKSSRRDPICRDCRNAKSRLLPYNPLKRREEYLRNPEKHRLDRVKRRGRLKNATGATTKQKLKEKFDYFGNRCVYCGTGENLSIEHLIPLSRNGTNWTSNLAPSCLSCN